MQATDREIVNSILAGDKEKFSVLVRRYTSDVLACVMSLTKRKELSIELTQQTFVRAYERLEYFRSESLKGWLLTIAWHLATDVLDAEKRRRNVPVERIGDAIEEQYSAEHEQQLQSMERAIEALPADDRDIIRMHYFEKRQTKEIAAKKGISQSNVLVRLHRIRERLRTELEKRKRYETN